MKPTLAKATAKWVSRNLVFKKSSTSRLTPHLVVLQHQCWDGIPTIDLSHLQLMDGGRGVGLWRRFGEDMIR
jgi:hypothetical protein